MKKTKKNELILAITALLGLAAAFLRNMLLSSALDEKGLLIPGHPTTIALWVLCLGFLAWAALVSRSQNVTASFREHFPPCRLRGTLGILGGVLVLLYGVLVLKAQLLAGVFGAAAGICMIFTGACRLQGRQPSPMFHCIVCIFFIIRLVLSFQTWSADPQLQDYVLQLMACISVMMFAYHRASSDANQLSPKRTAFFSLCAGFFCLASLSDPQMRLLLLGAGLWSVGAAPTLEKITEKPDEAEL